MKLGNLNLNRKNNLLYLTFPNFEKYKNLFHIFTTRKLGESDFDLGLNTETPIPQIYKNYIYLANTFDLDVNNFILSDQVHGDNILIVNNSHKSDNFLFNRKIKNVDGLITNIKNLFLITLYADCTPIYFFDPIKNVVGLAHSGWKGTLKEIGKKTVLKIAETFGSNPEDLLIALGPSIGSESFEVKEDVKILFENKFRFSDKIIKRKNEEKYLIDIPTTIKYTLMEIGVKEKNIFISNVDTYKNTDILFSYRREGKTGRMAAIIGLLDS
ncbi:peptidoglycan editing factor PgeF [Marinitoga arctica]